MGNLFAYSTLFIWPLIGIWLYKKYPPVQATFSTIVGGYLLLPVKTAIDLPLIPALDKQSIPAIVALLGCRYIQNIKIRLIPKKGIERFFVIVLLITPIITVLNNPEPVFNKPGLTLYDSLAAIVDTYLVILPFIIGIQLIKTYEDLMLILKLLVMSALLYSILILLEVRLSPQLHTWIYGYFPHSFAQQVRYGGFRPVVFLGHGLVVAMYVAISFASAVMLYKQKVSVFRIKPIYIMIYLFVVLLLCKSLGSIFLAVSFFILFYFSPKKILAVFVSLLLFIFISYPLLSMAGFIPYDTIIQLAMNYDVQRGSSLAFRIHQEIQLLNHVSNKLLFGWGSWGRNRLPTSTTDGYWIIRLGSYGVVGFISFFGLIVASSYSSLKACKLRLDKKQQELLIGCALLVAIILVDQLPNASLASWMLLLSGGLLGASKEFIRKSKSQNQNHDQSHHDGRVYAP